MSDSPLPTWADIVAIGAAIVSGAYSYGVIGQKVKTLETAVKDHADRAIDLDRDFREVTDRLTRLEVGMTNVQSLLTEVRDTVRRTSRT